MLTTDKGTVYLVALPRNGGAARHHASTDGLSSPKGRGSLHGGISELGGSTNFYRGLDRGVQYDRPHRGLENRTPHEAFVAFAGVRNSEALTI